MITRCALCIALIGFTTLPVSARWIGNSGVIADLIFTDNFFLTEKDTESETYLNLRPYVNYSRTGAGATASFAYGPAFLFYSNNSDLNDIRHVGMASARVELVKDFFAIRARATANPRLVNPSDPATSNPNTNPDARTQTASFEIVPEITFPLIDNKYATVKIDPGVNFVYSGDTAGGDRNQRRTGSRSRVSINSGRYFNRMPWSLTYYKSVFDSDTNDGWGRVNGKVGYVFSSRYRLDFNLGYDNLDSRSGSNSSQGGLRWRLDFTWTPSERTGIILGAGKAFSGNDWLLRLRHRQKKTVWTADYRIVASTAAEEILDQEPIPTTDAFGEQISNPFNRLQECFGIGGISFGTPGLTNSVYIGNQFNAKVGYQLGRSRLSLRVRTDRREYERTGQSTFDGYGCFNVTRAVSRNASGSVSFDFWDHSDDSRSIASRDFGQHALRLTLRYRLSPRTSTFLSLNHSRRDADAVGGSFDENNVRLTFGMRL